MNGAYLDKFVSHAVPSTGGGAGGREPWCPECVEDPLRWLDSNRGGYGEARPAALANLTSMEEGFLAKYCAVAHVVRLTGSVPTRPCP